MLPAYELSRIRKIYNGRMILNIADLKIDAGEVFAIVGPSGAGKSTLLRLLNFLESPDGGTIRFNQQAINPASVPLEIRRKVTTVFQQPALLSSNVMANLQYGLRLRGIQIDRKQIRNILRELGLDSLSNAQAHTLSGGEAQRVALARALILNPAVLLLDEPTANLDPFNVELIEKVIKRINQDHQTTIVLVTHNIFQAKRLADRATLLLNGEPVETADAATFFENPTDERTRAFVHGVMVW